MGTYNATDVAFTTPEVIFHAGVELYVYSWAVVFYRSLVSFFGIPGNILILLVYGRRKSLGSAQILIQALAYSDLYVCLLVPFSVYYFIFEHNYTNSILCKIGTTAESFGWYTSICLTIAVAAERHVAICKPHTRRWSRRKTAIACGVCLFISALCIIPDAYGASTFVRVHRYYGYAYNACGPHGDDPRYRTLLALPRFVSPLLALPILFVIYVRIWRKVRKQNREIAATLGANAVSSHVSGLRPPPREDRSSEDSVDTQQESTGARMPMGDVPGGASEPNGQPKTVSTRRENTSKLRNPMSRLTRMLLLTTLFFATTWLMTLILFSFKGATDDNLDPNGIPFAIVSVVRLCPVLNHAINPVIYSYTNKRFRYDCKTVFCRQGR